MIELTIHRLSAEFAANFSRVYTLKTKTRDEAIRDIEASRQKLSASASSALNASRAKALLAPTALQDAQKQRQTLQEAADKNTAAQQSAHIERIQAALNSARAPLEQQKSTLEEQNQSIQSAFNEQKKLNDENDEFLATGDITPTEKQRRAELHAQLEAQIDALDNELIHLSSERDAAQANYNSEKALTESYLSSHPPTHYESSAYAAYAPLRDNVDKYKNSMADLDALDKKFNDWIKKITDMEIK